MKTFIVLCGLFLGVNACFAAPGYQVVKKLPLGGEGGWDYLTEDSSVDRLYVSRGTHVMVVDLKTGTLAGDIPGTLGVHGIALAPKINRGFTSNGKANTCTIFDRTSLKVLGQVKTGENPDAILYEPVTNRVFTFNGRSNDATIFDASTGTVVTTIVLGGKPEFAVSDNKGKIFVNIETANEIAEIDAKQMKVTRKFALAPCEEPSGLAFDQERRLLFAACRNKMLAVMEADTGKIIATVPIGAKVDGCGFDPGTKLAFTSNGDGTMTVIGESAPGKFVVVDTVQTQIGSRTMAVDPTKHHIYLPAAQFLPPKEEKARPEMVKDSFVILVVGSLP